MSSSAPQSRHRKRQNVGEQEQLRDEIISLEKRKRGLFAKIARLQQQLDREQGREVDEMSVETLGDEVPPEPLLVRGHQFVLACVLVAMGALFCLVARNATIAAAVILGVLLLLLLIATRRPFVRLDATGACVRPTGGMKRRWFSWDDVLELTTTSRRFGDELHIKHLDGWYTGSVGRIGAPARRRLEEAATRWMRTHAGEEHGIP